jgi:cytochrome P450 family 4
LNISGNKILGHKWKKHRRVLTPAFHFQILEQFLEVFESCGNKIVKIFESEVGKESIDIYPYVTLCTLDIICGEFFNILRKFKINIYLF